MTSPIDDIFQPGIQLLFIVSILVVFIILRYPKWMIKNEYVQLLHQNKILLYIIAGCGIYHFFIFTNFICS